MQLLFEVKPVYNNTLFLEWKKDLLKKRIHPVHNSNDLIGNKYLRNILNQFFEDIQPDTLAKSKDLKTVIYRTLYVLGIKLSLISRLWFDDINFLSNHDLHQFLNNFNYPTLYKLLDFNEKIKKIYSESPWFTGIEKVLQEIIQHHLGVLTYFITHSPHLDELSMDCRAQLKRLLLSCQKLFELLKENKQELVIYSSRDYLLHNENFNFLIDNLK